MLEHLMARGFMPGRRTRYDWSSTDRTVKVWESVTKKTHTLHGHTSAVESVAFSPDGEWIASASRDEP